MNVRKIPLYVSVFGIPGSGKTTAMQLFQKILEACGIEVRASWGPEGSPKTEPSKHKLKAVAEKTIVYLIETQKRKYDKDRHESPDDFQVKVQYTPGIGYSVALSVLGTVLRHDFGDKFPILKERARATAARLANELGVDVIDEVSNDVDPYRQNKNFSISGDS
jgi:hypothetical protein